MTAKLQFVTVLGVYTLVAVTIPRETFDRATDWSTFASLADAQLLEGWGEGLGVSRAIGIALPPALALFPAAEIQVPPSRWDEGVLPPRQGLLALSVTRRGPDSAAPVHIREGTYPTWAALQTSSRDGEARVVIEVDLLQRPCPARADLG